MYQTVSSFYHVLHWLRGQFGWCLRVTEKETATESFFNFLHSLSPKQKDILLQSDIKWKLLPLSLVSPGGRHLEFGIHADTGPARPTRWWSRPWRLCWGAEPCWSFYPSAPLWRSWSAVPCGFCLQHSQHRHFTHLSLVLDILHTILLLLCFILLLTILEIVLYHLLCKVFFPPWPVQTWCVPWWITHVHWFRFILYRNE